VQFVRVAPQVSQLRGSDVAVSRLGKALAAARQRLIGTEDSPSWKGICHGTCFCMREVTRNARRIIDTGLSLDLAFVDCRRSYFEA